MIPPYWTNVFKAKSEIRPFFGWISRYANGPGNRTKRMINEFGNYYINPNIIYAQSGWSIKQLDTTLNRAHKNNIPVVLNQNGWYYPAWHSGDWRSANNQLLRAHERSRFVIYQSHFCIKAMTALTGVAPSNPFILHNAIKIPRDNLLARNPKRPTLWLSGVFHSDADHILLPALEAMEIFVQRQKEDLPLLKIAGYFDISARKSEWYSKVQSKLNALSNRRACVWLGRYSSSDLSALMQDVTLALHITSKDSCPNAVLERMALGVGHIYANSGGTPELVGDAGIGVNSPLDWSRQSPVAVDELVEAISQGLESWKMLADKSLERVKKKFSWDRYIASHREIFSRLIL